ncbi:DUF1697 domain-containing protein [Microbulbifer variabilis]|uniref:DUF1697 domain-containing protein n=1 Tax=Microbulbifer variabilis TaxID=266805 RepID=UPI001CFF355A|nr:DUF1697 domain-containing protein [Microbulbifer variabilis]
MKTYILLFRGINVGGKNIIPMKELKSLLEGEGYESVNTYIQSGNVVFRSKAKSFKDITLKVEKKFGFSPELLVLEKSEFEDALSFNPFTLYEGKTVHLYFCKRKPILDKKKLDFFAADTENYKLHGSVFYLHAPNGIGRSKLVSNLELCLGVPATGRNLNTVLKLQGMAENL